MKLSKRLLCGLMALLMAMTLFPGSIIASAAETSPSPQPITGDGEITATLRLDYSQSLEALRSHDVKVTLTKNDVIQGEVNLFDTSVVSLGDYPVSLEAKNADGDTDNTGWPKFLVLKISGLQSDKYTLGFTGLGYKDFYQSLDLSEYSQHVTLGTGDGSFTLGDVNSDGSIDAADRDVISRQLSNTDADLLSTYDFNGDGKIDIIDLAYVNSSIQATGGSTVADGAILNLPLDIDSLNSAVSAMGVQVDGSIEDLFKANGESVTLSSTGSEINLPIEFSAPVEMGQLNIVTPQSGGLNSGTVIVEFADGSTEDHAINEGKMAAFGDSDSIGMALSSGNKTITIPLNNRVPVKKISIRVNKTESGTVTIQSIQFLKDIIPENPVAANRIVTGLTANAGSEAVELTWRQTPNVTGYKVYYWADGSTEKKSLSVDIPRANVTGLDNLKKYWFQVSPTADGWEGDVCEPISATPQPAKAPDAPDMVSVQEQDGALAVSWKQSKGATYYEVYYKEKDSASGYKQTGGKLLTNSLTISGLTNGTTYSLYIIAGNDMGKSGQSRISEGTPKAVNYEAPEGLPKAGLLDRSKIQSIRLGDPNNYAPGEYTDTARFTPNNLIDGDYRTHWTTKNWSGNEHVICTFKEPVDLQAAFWVPRLDKNYPNYLRAYSVQVWYQGEDINKPGHLIVPDPQRGGQDNNGGSGGGDVFTWPNMSNYGKIAQDRFGILPFGPCENIIQISVAAEQRDYNLVSCSELLFMEYDPSHCLPQEINELFSNELHTGLKSGVDKAKINALRARLNSDEKLYYLDTATMKDELDLAEELLSGKSSGAIIEGVQSRNASADSSNYSQSGSVLQPLKVTAGANQEITIYVEGIPEGEKLEVFASQYNAEASAWLSSMGSLHNGRNILMVPKIGSQSTQRGGSLYFTYSGIGADSIKLHIRRGTNIPVLELSDWYKMTEVAKTNTISNYLTELDAYIAKAGITESNKTTNIKNVTEISTPTVLLSIPALAVKNSTTATGADRVQALFNSVLAWEDVMHICKFTQGIDKTYEQNDMQTRQNIRCMQMFSGAFMYAAGNHIGIGYGSCAGMAGGTPVNPSTVGTQNNLFGWGISHEIGHNMDKLGRAEITNNIYALMVQTYDGNDNDLQSRLELSGKYPEIFNKVAQGLPGESNNVFVQLGMYWQLHLAYDDASDPMGFFNRFFKAWKAGTYTKDLSNLSYDDKVALTAAGVVGKNLNEFFTRWGMRLSDSVEVKLNSYDNEPRAIWYLSDQSRRERIKGTANGSLNFDKPVAALKSGTYNEIEISASVHDAKNIQGFEIIRDNRSIAFVPYSSKTGNLLYTDIIGSGNHLSFSYSVRVYDVLGNMVSELSAGQVRVAYDKTVPSDAYTLQVDGNKAVFTMKEETPISGLKLANTKPANGSFTVEITDKDDNTVTARQGNFNDNQSADDPNSYVTYLNKPGTDSTDGTIWTYDAKIITVTGLPEGINDSDIQLISYAGDDVSFWDDPEGFTGVLSADYDAGNGEIIKAGTLVIVGTYRGDPYFCHPVVKGLFTTTKTIVNANGSEEIITEETEREIDGEMYVFAQVPEDKKVSDISDGLFIFVPDVQREAELQETTHCNGVNLLPSQLKLELLRVDDPTGAPDKSYVSSSTLWVHSPGGTDLPKIELKQN